MHQADELIALVREEEELFERLDDVHKRIAQLRSELGATTPSRTEDSPPRPTPRRPSRGAKANGRADPAAKKVSSTMVLSVMLKNPGRAWTVADLHKKFPAYKFF